MSCLEMCAVPSMCSPMSLYFCPFERSNSFIFVTREAFTRRSMSSTCLVLLTSHCHFRCIHTSSNVHILVVGPFELSLAHISWSLSRCSHVVQCRHPCIYVHSNCPARVSLSLVKYPCAVRCRHICSMLIRAWNSQGIHASYKIGILAAYRFETSCSQLLSVLRSLLQLVQSR